MFIGGIRKKLTYVKALSIFYSIFFPIVKKNSCIEEYSHYRDIGSTLCKEWFYKENEEYSLYSDYNLYKNHLRNMDAHFHRHKYLQMYSEYKKGNKTEKQNNQHVLDQYWYVCT